MAATVFYAYLFQGDGSFRRPATLLEEGTFANLAEAVAFVEAHVGLGRWFDNEFHPYGHLGARELTVVSLSLPWGRIKTAKPTEVHAPGLTRYWERRAPVYTNWA